MNIEERKLALAEDQWNFLKKARQFELSRAYDLEYLKLTVVIVLLIVIVFYITCKFNAEQYTEPQLGLTKNDQIRSDPAFDWVW